MECKLRVDDLFLNDSSGISPVSIWCSRTNFCKPYLIKFYSIKSTIGYPNAAIGYGDGINWYSYCGNSPLSYVDPSGLGNIRIEVSFEIPPECISENEVDGQISPFITVNDWLNYNDFWFLLPDWHIYEHVTMDNDTFYCTAYTEIEEGEPAPDLPTFGTTTVGDVTVFTINKIGLIDETTMNNIIRPTIEEINEWYPASCVFLD